MKPFLITLLMVGSVLAQPTVASTPTETLVRTIDQLIAVVKDKHMPAAAMREEISEIVHTGVDFELVSKRVISKPWKKATLAQKSRFKKLFAKIMVATYFDLLQNYSNEKVIYGREQIKKGKYATVDTQIISGTKKIPIRYKLLKTGQGWKIYDFVVEGVSLVNSYRSNYKVILKKEGFDALLDSMQQAETAVESQAPKSH